MLEVKDWVELVTVAMAVSALLWRMGAMTQKFEQIGQQQAEEITAIKKSVDKVGDILISLAEIDGRIDRVEDRQMAQGKRLDETAGRLNQLIDTQINFRRQ